MADTKYLYGAAVQGIQEFIFQTNKLKDIVTNSELVERICTTAFERFTHSNGIPNGISVLMAAGNIKFIFDSKEACEEAVLYFPKEVVGMAPGITISQAVVKYTGNGSADFKDAVEELETRLRQQRNKPMRPTTLGLMGVLRSRQTGLPLLCAGKKDTSDMPADGRRPQAGQRTIDLCKKNFGMDDIPDRRITNNIGKLTGDNDWIAIIHADGNGLGQIVQKVGSDATLFKKFSDNLDRSTREAAQQAFSDVYGSIHMEGIIPFRPVVLSGDDHTMICRADLAVDYAKAFILHFEELTQKYLGDIITGKETGNPVFTEGTERDHLTACAGIAFIKSSYPFYYGYNLAEELCSAAKKDAKSKESIRKGNEIAPSCLMFYKVQDSFVEDYDDMVARELEPASDVSFEYGPYYIRPQDGRCSVDDLQKAVDRLNGVENGSYSESKAKDGNAVKSHLRQWMSLMGEDKGKARQKVERVKALLPKGELYEWVDNATQGQSRGENGKKRYPVYDVLSLNTIINQKIQTTKK